MKAFFGSERRWKPKDLKQLLRLGPPSDNATKEELKRILQNEFSTLGDDAQKADGPKLDERLRGYRLERLLFKLFFLEGLNPHPSFERRPKKHAISKNPATRSAKKMRTPTMMMRLRTAEGAKQEASRSMASSNWMIDFFCWKPNGPKTLSQRPPFTPFAGRLKAALGEPSVCLSPWVTLPMTPNMP